MSKIADISTNLQSCFTEIEAKGVTVPADSSLDDLDSLIMAIPDASHPDLDLPWLMADGVHGFILPICATMTGNNTVGVKAELTPTLENTPCLVGTSTTNGGGHQGLQQMTQGFRARFKMFSVSNDDIVENANNYAGLNSQWSDSSCPYGKQLWYYQSVNNNSSEWRAVLNHPGDTVTGGSGLAQPSSSYWPNYTYGILCRTQMVDNVSNPFVRVLQPAQQGVKVYDCSIFTGSWTSKTSKFHFKPILHWDSSWGKYRPCWKEDYNSDSNVCSTFAIANEASQVDSSVDGAYYIDVTQGLAEIGAASVTSSRIIETIPYEFDGNLEYTLYGRFCTLYTNSWTYKNNKLMQVNASGGGSATIIVCNATVSNSTWTHQARFYTNYTNSVYKQIYSNTSSTASTAYNYIVRWTPTTSGNFSVQYYGGAGSSYSKVLTSGSVATNTLVRNQPIKLHVGYNSGANGTTWLRVRNKTTGETTHFLQLCTYNGNYAYYDVITKTLYT